MGSSLHVLTWHVHGSYLAALARVPVEWYLPVRADRGPGYGGRGASFDWPANVHEVDAEDVAGLRLDCVVHQSHQTWGQDQFEILSRAQRGLPTIFIEHDPPRASPTDTSHPVDDTNVLVVHVTHFNQLMWDCGHSPTTVIEHGVAVPQDVRAHYERSRAVTALNDPVTRGRRVGFDVLQELRTHAPIDLVGMRSEAAGGSGEIPPRMLPHFLARYRAFCHPVRWTSLGLAVIEAMQVGLPIVGLACTELPTVIENGVHGWIGTDVSQVGMHLARVVSDPSEASRLGAAARELGRQRFGIDRFVADWIATLADVTITSPALLTHG